MFLKQTTELLGHDPESAVPGKIHPAGALTLMLVIAAPVVLSNK